MQVRLGVLLFGLPGVVGLLAPFGVPGCDVAVLYPPSLMSIVIAAALWRWRFSVRESLYLPLLIVGLAFDGSGLVASHSSSTMALVLLPALLWGSHYLDRRRDFVVTLCAMGLIYGVALGIDAPEGVALGGQWTFTMAYLTIAACVTHVSSRRLNALVSETREASLVDALTGLSNRRRLIDDLESLAPDEAHLVVLFDLNGFKAYNDRFGHVAGDDLLRELGRRFATAVTGIGSAYRMGGDEFCAILRGGEEARASLPGLMSAFAVSGRDHRIDAAQGTAIVPGDGMTASEVLEAADRRMYDHKRLQRRARLPAVGVADHRAVAHTPA